MQQTGRIVIVSGGAGGVGMAVTRRFAAAGDQVVVVEQEAMRSRIDDLHDPLIAFAAANVLDEQSVSSALDGIQQQFGRIDGLINVVGGYAAGQPVHELDASTWDFMFNLNMRSAFLMSKHAARHMIPRQYGRIVNFSSRAARDTAPGSGAYAVSKAGVIALTELQAKELLTQNITVNAVLPSIVDTPANRSAMPDADFSRWPKAEEVAEVVFFLASDAARLISGAAIPVYGRG